MAVIDVGHKVDPATSSVLAALCHTPTTAERLFLDPDEGDAPDATILAWLSKQGVPIDAIASPIAVRVTHVCITQEGIYTPNLLGDLALVLPVLDTEGVVDFCAWAPRTGETAMRLGVGTMLGGEMVGRDSGDGVTIAPLRIYRSPLMWLRARRQSVVVLDWKGAAIALSRFNVVAEDVAHAAELRNRLRLPGPVVQVPNGTLRPSGSSESGRAIAGASP